MTTLETYTTLATLGGIFVGAVSTWLSMRPKRDEHGRFVKKS